MYRCFWQKATATDYGHDEDIYLVYCVLFVVYSPACMSCWLQRWRCSGFLRPMCLQPVPGQDHVNYSVAR